MGEEPVSLEIRNDNTKLVADEINAAVLRALEQIGMAAEGYAKDLCPVDTGNLRNSITHVVDESDWSVYIGSNVEYAAPVELGTVKQAAQPYLKPSATDHKQTYRNIMEQELKGG